MWATAWQVELKLLSMGNYMQPYICAQITGELLVSNTSPNDSMKKREEVRIP